MKKLNLLRLVLLVVLISTLAIGCAKQPTETETEAPPPASSQPPAADKPVTDTQVKEQASETVAEFTRINFDFDEYVITSEAREILARNAQVMKSFPSIKVRIEGHCDERGSDEYNLALGERRAQATMNYLVSLGVPASRMSTISYGEERPLDPASNESAWAKNRRAEFVIR